MANYTSILLPTPAEDSMHTSILKCVKSFNIVTSEGEFSDKDSKDNLAIGIPKYMNKEYYEAQTLYVCTDIFFFLAGDYFIDVTDNKLHKCKVGTSLVDEVLVIDGERPVSNCKFVIATTSLQVFDEGFKNILHINELMVRRYVETQGDTKFTLEEGVLKFG